MICKQCGKEYIPKNSRSHYCSEECRNKGTGRVTYKAGAEATCAQCGATFIRSYGLEKYCCDECKAAAIRALKRKYYASVPKRQPREERCVICGESFVPRRKGQVICSDKCRWRQQTINRYCNGLTGKAREEYKAQRRKEQADAQRKPKPIKTYYHRRCKVCGEWFSTMNPKQTTCSTECSKRAKNARKQHRIPKAQMIDKDITLEALYRRDSGVCYLCGGLCDWDDRDKEKNTVGASYPSIDHIIPIARGGLHAWNNVRLAHFKCNQEKGADVIEHAEELIPANAYEFKREIKFGKKQTEQYSLDGKLIAVYPSTAEAERRTSVPQKAIQDCAKGRIKTSHGFIWRYGG